MQTERASASISPKEGTWWTKNSDKSMFEKVTHVALVSLGILICALVALVPPIIITVGVAIESTSVIIGLLVGMAIGTLSISSFGLIGYILTDHLLTGDDFGKYFIQRIPNRRYIGDSGCRKEPPGGYFTFNDPVPFARGFYQ